jgi:hypothetical protein
MDESELKRHLKTISEWPIPNLPSNFDVSVRAKIRGAKAIAIRKNWLDRLVSTLLRPQWATAVFAVTLLVGGNFGRLLADSENRPIYRPLGFEVFASDAPTLPSTLLSQSR